MKQSKRVVIVLAVVLPSVLIAYGAVYGWIQITAHQKANAIQAAYPQAHSVAEALVLQMQAQSESMQARNRAVWLAGRLRASAALPVMQKHYTQQPCQHDTQLCQYELKKAIQRCGGQI